MPSPRMTAMVLLMMEIAPEREISRVRDGLESLDQASRKPPLAPCREPGTPRRFGAPARMRDNEPLGGCACAGRCNLARSSAPAISPGCADRALSGNAVALYTKNPVSAGS